MSTQTPPPRTEVTAPEKRIPSTTTSPIAKKQKTMDPVNATTTTSPVTNPPGLPSFQIKKLSSKARTPTRGSEFAAGYDMYASKDTVIPARGKVLVETDIAMAVPAGTYGRIAPRSGLGLFPPLFKKKQCLLTRPSGQELYRYRCWGY
jgi:dUTP pyrophosphatase